jgi:hypothetical protein
MSRQYRRRAQAQASDDGLDPVRWQILCDMISAGSRGDKKAGHAATTRLASVVPENGVAATYLLYLMRHRGFELIGREPTAADLHDLAGNIYVRFARGGRADPRLLENTLKTFFDVAEQGEEVAGGMLVVAGAAALGAMLDDPVRQLEEMRPYLANWWRRNLEEIGAQGLLDEIRRS